MERLAALPALPHVTEQTLTALLEHVRAGSSAYEYQAQINARVALFLENGGATGERYRAHQLAAQGDAAADLGRTDEARTCYEQAAELYEHLVATSDDDEPDLPDHLRTLGRLYQHLGADNRARTAYTESLRLRDQQGGNGADWVTTWGDMIEVAELHAMLGDSAAAGAACMSAERLLESVPDDELATAMTNTGSVRWEVLAKGLRRLGKTDSALRLLNGLARSRTGDHELSRAGLFREIGLAHAALGRWKDAEQALEAVLQATGDRPSTLVMLASVQLHLGKTSAARATIARAATRFTGSEAEDSPHIDFLRSTDEQMTHLIVTAAALDAQRNQRWADAAGMYQSLLNRQQELQERVPVETEREHEVASTNLSLGRVRLAGDQIAEAVDPLTRAATAYRVIADLDPSDHKALEGEVDARLLLALCALKRGTDDVTEHLARAIEVVSMIPDPPEGDVVRQRHLASTLHALGTVAVALGQWHHAEGCFDRSVRVRLLIVDLTPGTGADARDLADGEYALGRVHQELGWPETAVSWFTRAVDRLQALAFQARDDSDLQLKLNAALSALATAHLRRQQPDEAEHIAARLVANSRALADVEPGDCEAQRQLATALAVHGSAHQELERLDAAADCYAASANILLLLVDLEPRDQRNVRALRIVLAAHGRVLIALGRAAEAEAVRRTSEGIDRRFPDTTDGD